MYVGWYILGVTEVRTKKKKKKKNEKKSLILTEDPFTLIPLTLSHK